MSVIAREIQIGGLAEQLGAEQGRLHPHQLRTLVVDGRGVEVIDLDIGVGPHRMRHRTAVFGELMGLQQAHVGDALHAARADVGGELLVAVDGETFLETELKPVAAGDAVAAPVVEILVRDDALDALKILVRGGVGACQHELVVEDIQALVLHGPHVEMTHRHDHVDAEIVFPPEAFLVPAHRLLQRLHGVVASVQIVRLHEDLQHDLAAGCRREAILDRTQVTRDQGKEVAGLGKGVLPGDQMPAVLQRALLDAVAVGQEHREALAIGDECGSITRHHIGAVQEIGDAPKPLRLALGAEHVAGLVKPLECCVEIGMDANPCVQSEPVGHPLQGERIGLHPVLGRQEDVPVDRHLLEIQLLAVEPERAVAAGCRRIPAHLQAGLHAGAIRIQLESEIDMVDQELGRAIVSAVDRMRRVAVHDDPAPG